MVGNREPPPRVTLDLQEASGRPTYRRYVYTIWNYAQEPSTIFDGIKEKIAYAVWQKERCPTTGREHLQCYVRYRNAVRGVYLANTLSLPTSDVRFECARSGDSENRNYCTKSDTRIAGPWELGVCVDKAGQRTDLEEIGLAVRQGVRLGEIADKYPAAYIKFGRGIRELRAILDRPADFEEKQVVCLIGPPGVGKTRAVWEVDPDVFPANLPGGPRDQPWFDGYHGQEAVLFDDYRGQLEYGFFLRLLDRYPLQVPVKGGFVQWKPRRIWITSNYEPNDWFYFGDLRALRRRICLIFRQFN